MMVINVLHFPIKKVNKSVHEFKQSKKERKKDRNKWAMNYHKRTPMHHKKTFLYTFTFMWVINVIFC